MKAKYITFEKIVEKCKGCEYIEEVGGTCKVYFLPSAWWRHGDCPLATHLEPEEETPLAAHQRRKRQQKQRRRK